MRLLVRKLFKTNISFRDMKLKKEIRNLADNKKSRILRSFFKTKKGEYGEGDKFLGVAVPSLRKIVNRNWKETSFKEIKDLMDSRFHEERLLGILIIVKKYENSNQLERRRILKFYLKNLERVNNWDLVDLSSPNLLGEFLLKEDRKILHTLAKSDNLWKRRVAIVSTFSLIRANQFEDALKISKILLSDKHDLIHKAVGWMLREIGKRDLEILRLFLDKNLPKIHNTSLRYSIEKMSLEERKKYLILKKNARSLANLNKQ